MFVCLFFFDQNAHVIPAKLCQQGLAKNLEHPVMGKLIPIGVMKM